MYVYIWPSSNLETNSRRHARCYCTVQLLRVKEVRCRTVQWSYLPWRGSWPNGLQTRRNCRFIWQAASVFVVRLFITHLIQSSNRLFITHLIQSSNRLVVRWLTHSCDVHNHCFISSFFYPLFAGSQFWLLLTVGCASVVIWLRFCLLLLLFCCCCCCRVCLFVSRCGMFSQRVVFWPH